MSRNAAEEVHAHVRVAVTAKVRAVTVGVQIVLRIGVVAVIQIVSQLDAYQGAVETVILVVLAAAHLPMDGRIAARIILLNVVGVPNVVVVHAAAGHHVLRQHNQDAMMYSKDLVVPAALILALYLHHAITSLEQGVIMQTGVLTAAAAAQFHARYAQSAAGAAWIVIQLQIALPVQAMSFVIGILCIPRAMILLGTSVLMQLMRIMTA